MSNILLSDLFFNFSGNVLVALAVTFVIACALGFRNKKVFSAVVIGRDGDPSLPKIVEDTYTKSQNRDVPYIIKGNPDYVVLPKRYISEYKSLPTSVVSFQDAVKLRYAGDYSTIGHLGSDPNTFIHAVKFDLTKNLGYVLEALQTEAEFAIPTSLQLSDDGWTEIPVYSKALRIVAILSGKMFVGYPLCRNEEWLETTVQYTLSAFLAGRAMLKIPRPIRRVVAPFVPEMKNLKRHQQVGTRLLRPIIDERLSALEKDPNAVLPDDGISWFLRNSKPGSPDREPESIALLQLILSLAAIDNTSQNFTHLMFDLCAYPEFIGGLRKELEEVLKQEGGILTKASMPKLRKMESFMKESQRLNPPSLIRMDRVAQRDFKFKDGLEIPKGTHTTINNQGINMDPSVYKDPEIFDGFRFSNLRDLPGNENKYQFPTTSEDSLAFGNGVHACPGRFFAANELKLVLSFVLQNYDFKFKDGQSRPANVFRSVAVKPDPDFTILMRKRRKSEEKVARV